MAKLKGNNKHNVTWCYAHACWVALKNNQPVPPIPQYDEWETDDTGGKGRVFVGKKFIEPMSVTCNGKTVYGEETA